MLLKGASFLHFELFTFWCLVSPLLHLLSTSEIKGEVSAHDITPWGQLPNAYHRNHVVCMAFVKHFSFVAAGVSRQLSKKVLLRASLFLDDSTLSQTHVLQTCNAFHLGVSSGSLNIYFCSSLSYSLLRDFSYKIEAWQDSLLCNVLQCNRCSLEYILPIQSRHQGGVKCWSWETLKSSQV